jgi:hypothetical protein
MSTRLRPKFWTKTQTKTGGSLRPEFLRRRLFCRICVYVRLLWGARRKPDAEMGYGTHLSLRLRPRLWMLLVLIISLITSTYCA